MAFELTLSCISENPQTTYKASRAMLTLQVCQRSKKVPFAKNPNLLVKFLFFFNPSEDPEMLIYKGTTQVREKLESPFTVCIPQSMTSLTHSNTNNVSVGLALHVGRFVCWSGCQVCHYSNCVPYGIWGLGELCILGKERTTRTTSLYSLKIKLNIIFILFPSKLFKVKIQYRSPIIQLNMYSLMTKAYNTETKPNQKQIFSLSKSSYRFQNIWVIMECNLCLTDVNI